MPDSGSVVLRLFPPYSTIMGQREVRVQLEGAEPAPAFFDAFCRDRSTLREMFFPSGEIKEFPGSTSVFRDGRPLGYEDVIRPGDILEVVTALTGG